MIYLGIIATVISHIVASLYMQKQKYNKVVTACFWCVYVISALAVVSFEKNIEIGFFAFFVLHFIFFIITSIGSVGENIFLFLTYSNSFCICIGARCVISVLFGDNLFVYFAEIAILVLMHLFLYKFLIPTYKKSKPYFSSGWWKFNFVLILFLTQFLNLYAFSITDKASAYEVIFEFVIFSIIFYSTLVLLFNLVEDVAEINKTNLENDVLKNVAYQDTLTGIQNRTAYAKFIRKQVLNHRNDCSKNLLFAIMDVDNLKNINDEKGHAAGDAILKKVGEFIKKHFIPLGCKCFRIGGDEFVVLFEEMSMSEVKEQIEKMNDDLFSSTGVTLSYGCSEVDFNTSQPFDLALETADAIMYSLKHQKKTQA